MFKTGLGKFSENALITNVYYKIHIPSIDGFLRLKTTNK